MNRDEEVFLSRLETAQQMQNEFIEALKTGRIPELYEQETQNFFKAKNPDDHQISIIRSQTLDVLVRDLELWTEERYRPARFYDNEDGSYV